jgi:hypothetical protein
VIHPVSCVLVALVLADRWWQRAWPCILHYAIANKNTNFHNPALVKRKAFGMPLYWYWYSAVYGSTVQYEYPYQVPIIYYLQYDLLSIIYYYY